jgi:hypothetical protein
MDTFGSDHTSLTDTDEDEALVMDIDESATPISKGNAMSDSPSKVSEEFVAKTPSKNARRKSGMKTSKSSKDSKSKSVTIRETKVRDERPKRRRSQVSMVEKSDDEEDEDMV